MPWDASFDGVTRSSTPTVPRLLRSSSRGEDGTQELLAAVQGGPPNAVTAAEKTVSLRGLEMGHALEREDVAMRRLDLPPALEGSRPDLERLAARLSAVGRESLFSRRILGTVPAPAFYKEIEEFRRYGVLEPGPEWTLGRRALVDLAERVSAEMKEERPIRRGNDGRWRYRKVVHLPDGSTMRVSGTPDTNTKLAADAAERAHIERALKEAAVAGGGRKEVPTFDKWFNGRFWREWVDSRKNKPSEAEASRASTGSTSRSWSASAASMRSGSARWRGFGQLWPRRTFPTSASTTSSPCCRRPSAMRRTSRSSRGRPR
jgi:hypothetical protein